MKPIIRNYVWKILWSLPHCKINQMKYKKKYRRGFDYENNSDISIISTNCIGGELYNLLGLRFNSPTINISMGRNDFVNFCIDLKGFMQSKLENIEKNKDGGLKATLCSPNGKTVKISFPHETKETEVFNNWEKRKKRINYDKLYIISDDVNLKSENYKRFGEIPCLKKIMFTSRDYSGKEYGEFTYYLDRYKNERCVGKYQEKTLKGIYRFQEMWDPVKWFENSD